MNKSIILKNGKSMPCIGYGTWQTPNRDVAYQAVTEAINCGYKHIDTAAIYGNEEFVGKAVNECINKGIVTREELFITSKLWNSNRSYDKAIEGFNKTLNDLKLTYLDLYLIHWPAAGHRFDNWKDINADTWKALETLYNEGKIKAIGVSNFLVSHLEPLLDMANIQPMVDQIEFHPGYTQIDTVLYCQRNNITVEAWSPLGNGRMLQHPVLCEIASKYNKSVAQVCLRWVLQNNVVPLPKSLNKERIIQNADVFNFELTDEDMNLITNMETCGFSGYYIDENME